MALHRSEVFESSAAKTLKQEGMILLRVRIPEFSTSPELIAWRPIRPDERYVVYTDGSFSTYRREGEKYWLVL